MKIPPANWFLDFYPDDRITVSDTDYSNETLALVYLKKLDHMEYTLSTGSFQLLLLDNHGPNCPRDFIGYCDNHRIISLSHLSHTTHLMELLDITKPWRSLFGVQPRYNDFNKVESLATTSKIQKQAFLKKVVTIHA